MRPRLPATESFWSGVDVPIPILPLARTWNKVEPVEEAMLNGFVAPVPCTDNVEYGVVVPIPTVTASVEVPPRTTAFEIPTLAFLPIAVMLVRAEAPAS